MFRDFKYAKKSRKEVQRYQKKESGRKVEGERGGDVGGGMYE
ncbi:MAG: hypothetical protein RR919_09520 [Bacteroidales bacterium]